jgi:hypothetical protein
MLKFQASAFWGNSDDDMKVADLKVVLAKKNYRAFKCGYKSEASPSKPSGRPYLYKVVFAHNIEEAEITLLNQLHLYAVSEKGIVALKFNGTDWYMLGAHCSENLTTER